MPVTICFVMIGLLCVVLSMKYVIIIKGSVRILTNKNFQCRMHCICVVKGKHLAHIVDILLACMHLI